MDNNAKDLQIQKMAAGVRVAAFLSLLTDGYEIFGLLGKNANSQEMVPIALGILGTVVLWQLSKALQAQKQQALFYWFGLLAIGAMRLLVDGAPFTWSILSIGIAALLVLLTSRLVMWKRNRILV